MEVDSFQMIPFENISHVFENNYKDVPYERCDEKIDYYILIKTMKFILEYASCDKTEVIEINTLKELLNLVTKYNKQIITLIPTSNITNVINKKEDNSLKLILIANNESSLKNRDDMILKVATDNTITIRKVKNTWTRKEVEDLILGYWKDHASKGDGNKQDCLNWIEKNL